MTQASTRLLYKKPAKVWNEALPIGNGTLGGMVFGGVKEEIISLNHDELWSGYPKNDDNAGKNIYFEKARELALDGRLIEATKLIEEKFLGGVSEAYMPLGDLVMKFTDQAAPKKYKRYLDLKTAIAGVEYESGKTKYIREMFASYPDNIIAVRISASGEQKLSFNLSLKCQLHSVCGTNGNKIYLSGECPSSTQHNGTDMPGVYYCEDERRGIQFLAGAAVHTDGNIVSNLDSIEISGATSAIIYLTAETSFNGYDKHPFLEGKEYKKPCIERLEALDALSYDDILSRHIADYADLFGRVTLDLGNGKYENTSADYRLKNNEIKKDDKELCVLLYNYGRYLAIASSRKGTQPSNLQGIWNNKTLPPWRSNYTININTEMNYWPVLMCSMPELHLPLVEMIKELSVKGESTARDYYNAPGFVSHHNTDLWRFTKPVSGSACWGFWPFGSGWFCHHLFEHYEYTNDVDFLRNTAYPVMRKAAEFYNALLVKDKDGYYIFSPSTSPENLFKTEGGAASVSQTSTMSMSIIKELFGNCIKSAKILNIDDNFIDELGKKLELMLPYKIGSSGQLLEWYEEMTECEVHHRHVSHLYGLHPANLIGVEKTPELAEACKKTLEIRGDDGTGWSLGWKINFWARLRDGDHAVRLLDKQMRFVSCRKANFVSGGGTYANLFDAHPPFQIDGNFGAVSGITEMLMQSYDNKIYLLPALPSRWADGSVKGLTAKGNIKVDIIWRDGKLVDYKIEGKNKNTVVIYSGEILK